MMTIKELKASGSIIFECISGSRAYGLQTPTSDTDIKGVFILPKDHFYSLEYIGQVHNETNDIVYYELKKFIELCAKNNPNILEMLDTPEDCILYKHELFDEIKQTYFLSKLCKQTFANYAFTQIKKARGLHKKINNPMEKEKKSILDFCVVRVEKESFLLPEFLEQRALKKKYCGLAKIPNMKNCFNLFYNEKLDYKGIAKEGANEVQTSSIPKEELPIALLYCNLEGYSSYCKKYKEYWQWVEDRNEARYQNNIAHAKNYDSKNMMHTMRLLHMAEEIGKEGKIGVRRKERNYLLAIKNGEFTYDFLVDKAEEIRAKLDAMYTTSSLPEKPDLKLVNSLLVDIRTKFYS